MARPVSPEAQPLTRKGLAILVAGLLVLVGLTLHRLGSTGAPKDAYGLETFTGTTMGTVYTVKVVAPPPVLADAEGRALAERIKMELESVDEKMSTYRPDSELSRFNASHSTEPFPMSPETVAVFVYAHQVSKASGGAFDITVGPLVNAWGFGPNDREGRTDAPTPEEIEDLRGRIGYEKIEIDSAANTVRKTQPDLYCDLSAIAKGYAVDQVARALDELGIENYLVEVGGELRSRGQNDRGQPWVIGIEKPVTDERTIHRTVPLSGWSMATSGDYRNYYEANGIRISHTINPKTGRPITHPLAAVTVFHRECVLADAYATALMVLGPDAGHKLAEQLGLPAVLIIRRDDGTFEERTTQAFDEEFQY